MRCLFCCFIPALVLVSASPTFAATTADVPPPLLAKPAAVWPPIPCSPVKVTVANQNILLSGPHEKNSSQMYFLKNKSQKSLWLDHPTKRGTASAGWASYLQTERWSAIVVDKKDFSLSCAVIQPGKVDYLNCAQAISVCAPAHVAIPANRKGSYWLVENKPLEGLQKYFKKDKK